MWDPMGRPAQSNFAATSRARICCPDASNTAGRACLLLVEFVCGIKRGQERCQAQTFRQAMLPNACGRTRRLRRANGRPAMAAGCRRDYVAGRSAATGHIVGVCTPFGAAACGHVSRASAKGGLHRRALTLSDSCIMRRSNLMQRAGCKLRGCINHIALSLYKFVIQVDVCARLG